VKKFYCPNCGAFRKTVIPWTGVVAHNCFGRVFLCWKCGGEVVGVDSKNSMDDVVRRGDIIEALHSGEIDCGYVSFDTYKKMKELSKKIDNVIMSVPGVRK